MIRRDLVVTKFGATFLGRRFSCAIGRGGITKNKKEGDGATPKGIYPFKDFSVFFREDRVRPPCCATQLNRKFILPDDPTDPAYNTLQIEKPGQPHRFRHERMWRSDPLYDVVVDINYNADPVIPGCGSAIFLHVWRKPRHPTEGCVAFAKQDLLWILKNGRWSDRLIIR